MILAHVELFRVEASDLMGLGCFYLCSWNIKFDLCVQIERQCVCQECARALKVVQERERKEKHRDAPPPLRALRHTDNCCLLKHFCHFLPFSIHTFAIFSSSCCCSRCLFVVFDTFELLRRHLYRPFHG